MTGLRVVLPLVVSVPVPCASARPIPSPSRPAA
ncbi:hypothetical protein BD833_104231 [Blastococcus xanthinilyticus]|uniref:Uncharacterized protein n=1 Tax=Blastococcus xanthinilyticus TaxID=1564164 RepID=A0A5S5CYA6_9ACTN|nr:hypothetical protein BD833_104231 [Blastococcus xanthinilyticus]